MADILPTLATTAQKPSSSTVVFGTSETIIGLSMMTPAGTPETSTDLGVRFMASLAVVSGTATLRLRQDSISGTILATIVATVADTVFEATGNVAKPTTATKLFVTGQNSAGTSTSEFFQVAFDGDGTDPTFGAIDSTGYEEMSPYASGVMVRDLGDRTWFIDPATNTSYSRSQITRVMPEFVGAGHLLARQIRPQVVEVDDAIWVISMGARNPSFVPGTYDSGFLEITVIDKDTKGITITPTTELITGVINFAAVYDGLGTVWIFYVDNTADIGVFRRSAGNASVGVAQSTYRTVTSGEMSCIDAVLLDNLEIAVVASSLVEASHEGKIDHSYLDPVTAAARTSPAGVTTTITILDPSALCTGGVSITKAIVGAATAWEYFYLATDPADGAEIQVRHVIVNGATLAKTSDLLIRTTTMTETANVLHVGIVTSWATALPDTYVTWIIQPASGARVLNIDNVIGFFSVSGGIYSELFGSWIASKAFLNGDRWCIITGYDDSDESRVQRCLHVREIVSDSTGKYLVSQDQGGNTLLRVIAQFGFRRIAAAYHVPWSFSPTILNAVRVHTPNVCDVVQTSDGRFWSAAIFAGELRSSGNTQLITLDFAANYSRGVPIYGDMIVYPGGVPQICGPRDKSRDLSPLLTAPQAPTAGLGSGGSLGSFLVAVVFVFTDSAGRFHRSAPSFVAPHIFLSAGTRTITWRTLGALGAGDYFVELYTSISAGLTLHLQGIVDGRFIGAFVDQTITVEPQDWVDTSQLLYVTGGNLSNDPPPPCRNVTVWNGRLFMSGTTVDGEIFHSQEFEPTVGIRLSRFLRAEWQDSPGPITGMVRLDQNYLLLFRRNAIAVISGFGPDTLGAGVFRPQQISSERGTELPNSLLRGPAGGYFQSAGDGRICVVPGPQPAVDISDGIVDELVGRTVVATVFHGREEHALFFLDNSKILVLDTRRPAPGSPAGQWYIWESDGLASPCVGATEDEDGDLIWMQQDKAIRRFRTTGNQFSDQDSLLVDKAALMKVETWQLTYGAMHRDGYVSSIKILGTFQAATDFRLAVTNDEDVVENHDFTSADPFDYTARPANTINGQEMRLSLEEVGPNSLTEGPVLDGVEVAVIPRGHKKHPRDGGTI